jgi:hypothetical protein
MLRLSKNFLEIFLLRTLLDLRIRIISSMDDGEESDDSV